MLDVMEFVTNISLIRHDEPVTIFRDSNTVQLAKFSLNGRPSLVRAAISNLGQDPRTHQLRYSRPVTIE